MPGRALRAGEESVGQIKFFSSNPGQGWLPCNGDAVSKTRYPELVGLLDEGMASTALPIDASTYSTGWYFAANGEVHTCRSRFTALGTTSFSYSSDGVNFTDYPTGLKTAVEAKLTAQYGSTIHTVQSAFLIHTGSQYVWFLSLYINAIGACRVYAVSASTISGTWTVNNNGVNAGDASESNRGIINAGYVAATGRYWFRDVVNNSISHSTDLVSWTPAGVGAAGRGVTYHDGSQFVSVSNYSAAYYGSDLAALSSKALPQATYGLMKSTDGYYALKSGTVSTDNTQTYSSSTINGTYASAPHTAMLGTAPQYTISACYHPSVGVILQQGDALTGSPASALYQAKNLGDRRAYRQLRTSQTYPALFFGIYDAVTISGGFAALSCQDYRGGLNANPMGSAVFRYGLVLPEITPLGDGRQAYIRVYR